MKILIADDDQISGILLKKQISTWNFDPIYVTNGKDAYKILTSPDSPQIALLDWIMPEMTGFEVVRALHADKHKEGGIPHYLILLTAKNAKEDVVKAIKAGADDYIVKPFNMEELKVRLGAGRRIVELTQRLSNALKKAKRLNNFIARFDRTTGLPNHIYLLEQIENICRTDTPYILLFINLDNFKVINQFYGIEDGDCLLNAAGGRLRHCFKDEIFTARRTSDEFALLFPLKGKNFEEFKRISLAVANKIHNAFKAPFIISGEEIFLTVSIGGTIISYDDDKKEPNEYVRRAELALKRAKKAGGNITVIHDSEAEKELKEKFELERDIEKALKKKEFLMFLQPQFTADGRVVSAEALCRWRHPERGLISPAIFIPITEEKNLIGQLGKIMIEKACKFIARTDNNFSLSVNVSPQQFQEKGFTGFLEYILEETKIAPERLTLEVTEGMFIKDVQNTINKMERLIDMGFSFSVDDFGTGYSSLLYLKQLPLRELKIDRAFVKELPNDKKDIAIVDTIIDIAENFGFDLVVEGVETKEQVDFLAPRGDMVFQGYYFARPAPEDEVFLNYFKKM